MEASETIAEYGKTFLNNVLNMKAPQSVLISDFMSNIVEINKINPKEILEEYIDIANMLNYSFKLYRLNIDYFNTYSLQVNSVISTSLLVEQHIHDLIYNKDLLLTSNQKSDKDKLEEAINVLETMNKKQNELFKEPIPSTMKEAERLHFMCLQDDIVKNTNSLLEDLKHQLSDAKEQEKKTQNEIKERKKDYYFITNLSEDTDFHYLFKGVIMYYVANDIIEGVREKYFKNYDIKIKDRVEKSKRVHCLKNANSYPFTTEKISKLINLSLLDGEKINDRMLFIFTLFINLEKKTKEENYTKTIKKHINQAFKEMQKEKNKTNTLSNCTLDHSEKAMEEMGWFKIGD